MTVFLEKMAPIWGSRDLGATEAFYARLGFVTVHRDGDAYLLMKRGGAELHFEGTPDHDPATSVHQAYLRPSDVDAFSAEVEALGLPSDPGFPRFLPAEDRPWGMREAVLWDPDGNVIRAGHEI